METYFEKYFNVLSEKINEIDKKQLIKFADLICGTNKKNKKYSCRNVGSASIASHVSVDFVKAAKIRSINFNEANFLTCFSNDYGYENWSSL